MRDGPNFEGASNPDRHRTVGPHRARCSDCGGWCYPDGWCDCCHWAAGHRRVWVGADLSDLDMEAAVIAEIEQRFPGDGQNLWDHHLTTVERAIALKRVSVVVRAALGIKED